MIHCIGYLIKVTRLLALIVTISMCGSRLVEADVSEPFVFSTKLTAFKGEVNLHVRVEYAGEGTVEVHKLFEHSIRITNPGNWKPLGLEAQIFTGPGIITTETLRHGECLESDYPIRSLFDSVSTGSNDFEIEIVVVPIDKGNAVRLKKRVHAELTAEEASRANRAKQTSVGPSPAK